MPENMEALSDKELVRRLKRKVTEYLLTQFDGEAKPKASMATAAVNFLRSNDVPPTPDEIEKDASELTTRPELILRLPFVSDAKRATARAAVEAKRAAARNTDERGSEC
jgi:hypothetical protein